MDSIKITLETLYDILRNEKKKEDLQQLESTFFLDVAMYMREKKGLLDTKKENADIFASSDKSKLDYEIRSIQRILKELYEKREKKIIDIALNKSRTGSDIINTSAMLREEKEFYEHVLSSLNLYRKGVLGAIFHGNLPEMDINRIKVNTSTTSITPKVGTPLPKITKDSNRDEKTETDASKETKKELSEVTTEKTKVKFIHPMPSFVWKDMKVYGPYDQGDEIDIFPEVADLLVRKGRAEKI